MKYSIWDIDNCLADDSPRLHLIDWHLQGDERYARYNAELIHDRPCHVKEFRLMQALACKPIFFTGRPEMHRLATSEWLKRHFGIQHPDLRMRPNGTVGLTPATLKAGMLHQLFNSGVRASDIGGAFDDLPAVVEMYRSYGLPGVVLAIGDPAAAYEPADIALQGAPA